MQSEQKQRLNTYIFNLRNSRVVVVVEIAAEVIEMETQTKTKCKELWMSTSNPHSVSLFRGVKKEKKKSSNDRKRETALRDCEETGWFEGPLIQPQIP